ncbi:hypothetical protein MRQ36_22015 [Micromonospora sp. R77]|uniref:hypothetical protein n=1 Tax=Micromonospora sp. R77 TaxID=2925836 RepID=UPI001F6124BF|nr:hypothetical protein [Micromonospora sp. R77]MCI4065095.1 hypothetical protein [Micromonospora sp. R77]
MTTDAVPAGGDPRRLLAEARGLARRVRLAQRVTWLPLLVLAVVTLGAIPVYRYSQPIQSDCRPVNGGEVCKVWFVVPEIYWVTALACAYVVIAYGYLRVARHRGVDARVRPYVLTGVAVSLVLVAAEAVGAGRWLVPDPQDLLHPSASVLVLFRLLSPTGGIGLALLVLAWLERNVALLMFTVAYLVVVLLPVTSGWGGGWLADWQHGPLLALGAGLLALGSAGFALAQRLRRPR